MPIPNIAQLCAYHGAPGAMLAKVRGALRGSIETDQVLIGVSQAAYALRIINYSAAPAVNDLIEIRAEAGEYAPGRGTFAAFADSRYAGAGSSLPGSANDRQYFFRTSDYTWHQYFSAAAIWATGVPRPAWIDWRGRYATRQAALDGAAGNGQVYVQSDGAILTISGHVASTMPETTTIFAGTVERVRISMDRDSGQRQSAVCAVTARDYVGAAGSVLITERFEGQTLKQILSAIIADYLTPYGITLAPQTPDGPTIAVVSWSYVPAARAIEEVTRLAGYLWRIDPAKRLHAFAFAGAASEFSIGAQSRLWQRIEIERDLSDYRSVQYIRGGQATVGRNESFRADGTSRTFPLALVIANGKDTPPRVTYGGATENAVILGEAAGNWEWRPGGQEIVRSATAAPLTAGQTVQVQYTGAYPILVHAARSGASGTREKLTLDETIGTLSAARQRANALLDRYAAPAEDLKFVTRESGIQVGQAIAVDEPLIGAAGQYIVEQVTAKDDGQTGALYTVRAIKRSAARWREYWTSEREALEGLAVRADEILQEFVDLEDVLSVWDNDSAVLQDAGQAGRVGAARVGTNIVGDE